MLKKIYNHQLARFLFIGGIGVVFNLLIFYFLADVGRVNPLVASTVAFIFIVSQNYLLNHYWSFNKVINYHANWKAFFKYIAVYISGLIINLAVLKIIIYCFSPHPQVTAQLIGIALATGVNYMGVKKFVFK
ncbi:MAG: GtrA family protein [Patescibacteria group bacterium]